MTEIHLYGTVGESFWGEECFTPSSVRAQLADLSGPITVRINSGGGIAVDGQTIYNLLRDYPGEKTVIIDGIAASAASLIAMAGDRVVMRMGSILMIHDPAWPDTDGRGTEDDHLRAASWLKVVSTAYARVYAKAAGISTEAARKIMRAETYYDGSTAMSAGFADETEDEEAQEVAAFDYRLYDHAPKALLSTGARVASHARSRKAVMAMIMGVTPAGTGAKTMTKKTTAVAPGDGTTPEEDEELIAAQAAAAALAAEGEDGDEDLTDEGEDGEDGDEDLTDEGDEGEDGDERAAPKAKAKASLARILDICVALGRPATEARDMFSRRLTLKQALAEVTAKTAKEVPVTANIRPGAPRARITRDERDTRRQGMTGALVAQMARDRDVTGPARDFMGLSLTQMAAECVGHRGPLRRGSSEVRVMEMALGSGSVSDFPAIFENALNKRLLASYLAAEPTYRKIATRMDFTDFRPHPISAIGDFPTLLPVGESGEIKFGSTADKKELVTLGAYARGFQISRQMMINDDLGAIDRMLATRGMAVAAFEDAVFYATLLGGANADGPTLLETTRQMYNTTDMTKAGSAAAITVTSISVGRAAMRKKKGLGASAEDRLALQITPSIILVGPDKETEAEQLLATIQPQETTKVNPFSGRLEVVVTSHITSNAWYLFADPVMAPVMMYGYLAGEEGPRMRMDEPFGSQGVAYSVELDFGTGGIDYRGSYKNPGA